MASETKPQADPETGAVPPRRKRSRARRWGLWSLASTAVLVVGVTLMVLFLVGQTLRAPDWLRDRIEDRIAQNLSGLHLTFGDIDVVVHHGWQPRLRLRDVVLSRPDGQPIVELADARASLAMQPLLRGQVQVKDVTLTGAFATLRRDASGNVALFLGQGPAPVESSAGVPQLIKEWEKMLTAPQLAALKSVEMEALTLRYEDARLGRAWTLDGGRVQLDRDKGGLRLSGSFALLSGGDTVSSVEMNYASQIGETKAEFGVVIDDINAQDIAVQSVALNWLNILRAPISGALRGSIDTTGVLGPVSATLQIGAGVVQPTDQTRPIPFSGARSYFTYEPADQVLVFDELSISSEWVSGLAEGRAYLGGVSEGRLTDLIGQFTLVDFNVNPDGLYDHPLTLDKIAADFRLELDPFRLTLGQMNITDQQSQMQVSGDLVAKPNGWDLALDGMMSTLTPERLLELWPNGAAPKPRLWVTNNLTGGTLNDLNFALRVHPDQRPNIYIDFDFADTVIQFVKTLPPITGATGHASLNGGRFVATATAGEVIADQGGPVDVSGTSFIIPDVSIKKAAPGVVRIAANGSVTAAMSLLDRPPLSVLKDTPLPVDLADGQAKLTGTLALPLKDVIKFDEMEFHLKGDIDDVTSTALIPGQTVTAERLRVTGDQTQIVVRGDGQIGTIPTTVQWRQPLGVGVNKSSQAVGTVELSQQLVDAFEIGLPPGTVTGQGSGDFTLDLGAGAAPVLTLKSNLRGVGLHLPELGWHKSNASDGLFELTGVLADQAKVDRLIVKAAGLTATGTVLNRPGGGLERALFSSVRLGGWLDARVEMVGRGTRPPEIRILGGTLDMRKTDFGESSSSSSGSSGPSSDLQVSLDRLQVTDTVALTGFTGQFKTTGGLNGNFRGNVNGQTQVVGQISPQAGRSAVRVQSQDAGGVFRSAGILERARGGVFGLTLLPSRQAGEFDGTLRVTNTQVKDAPVIAALLNSVSVIGFFDEVSGQGIQFAEVDGKFRLGPSRLTLFSGSATGPSIGMSMDGTYDVASGRLDMRGAISPVYLLNSVGSFLTRKGEGIISFNYTLRGTSADPKVVVNPLSALTPGMFRDLLRSAPPPKDTNLPEVPRKPSRAPDALDGSTGGR